MFKISILALTLLTLSGYANSQKAFAEVPLFKEFTHDSPNIKFLELSERFDCPPHFGKNTVCVGGIDFAECRFAAVLYFESKQLVQVTLTADYDRERLEKVQAALAHFFTLISMSDRTSRMDIAELKRKISQENERAVTRADYEEQGLNDRHLAYAYVEGVHVTAGAANEAAVYARAHENDRAVELVVAEGVWRSPLLCQNSLPGNVDSVISIF
jgi:hypothetical protein